MDMDYGTEESISAVRDSRREFLKLIDGITEEQAVWKPYAGCKSIAETLDHLIWSDLATVEYAKSGQEPDYTTAPDSPPADSLETLKQKAARSHQALIEYLTTTYGGAGLSRPFMMYGHEMPIGAALAAMLVEQGYHTGQAAYIRMASDPSWDYYTAIYS